MSCVRQQEVRYELKGVESLRCLKEVCVQVAKYRSKLSVDALWVRLRGINERTSGGTPPRRVKARERVRERTTETVRDERERE